jgi:hypothetical protein
MEVPEEGASPSSGIGMSSPVPFAGPPAAGVRAAACVDASMVTVGVLDGTKEVLNATVDVLDGTKEVLNVTVGVLDVTKEVLNVTAGVLDGTKEVLNVTVEGVIRAFAAAFGPLGGGGGGGSGRAERGERREESGGRGEGGGATAGDFDAFGACFSVAR